MASLKEKIIQQAKKEYDEAYIKGDKAGMVAAHAKADRARGQYTKTVSVNGQYQQQVIGNMGQKAASGELLAETRKANPVIKPPAQQKPLYSSSVRRIGQPIAKAQQEKIKAKTYEDFNNTGTKVLAGAIEGFLPVNTDQNYHPAIQQNKEDFTDNKAYKGGYVGGMIGSFVVPYLGAGKTIAAAPKVVKAGDLLGKGITKLAPKLAPQTAQKVGRGIAGSVATDLAVGFPLNVNMAYNKEGLSGADALKNIATNTGIDLIAGGALEAIGGIVLKSGKKIANKADFSKLNPADQKEAMTEIERLAYESNVRKGKITPQSDTIYGNSFRPAAGALPAPGVTPEKVVSPEEAFTQWRKENFGGAFGNVSKEDMKALRELYAETTQPNYSAATGAREVPKTITRNELPKANRIPERPYELNQPVITKEGKPGKIVAHVPESAGVQEAYIVKPEGAKRKEMKVYKPEEINPSNVINPNQKQTVQPVSNTGIKPNKELNAADRLYQKTVDNQFAISKATRGVKTTADKNPTILASNARNARGTAEYSIKNHLVDMEGRKITDYGLEQLLLRPKSEQQAYENYLLHKHNIDRFRQDKPVFGEQVTDVMSRKMVADYEAQYPQFKGLSENLNDYNQKMIDEWLVKSGLIDQKLADILKKMYKNYVPTFREGGVAGKKYKTKGMGPGKVINQAVGGDEDIITLTKSYPAIVEKAIKSARKNEVYLGLLDVVEKHPEKMARWAKVVEDTAENKYKDAVTVTSADELIKKNGIDGIEEVSQKQLEIDSRNGKYYVTAMRNGMPVRMEVHKDLFDAMDSMNRIGNEGNLDGMADKMKKYATNPFKALITGYNPVFALKNIFRDVPTSFVQGTENNPIKWAGNLARASKSILRNDEQYKEFVALGGKTSGFFDAEKGLRLENIPTKFLRKGAEKLGAFNQLTETIPRYGEYLGTVRRGGGDYASKQQGIFNAGEVTVNFARQGDKVKAVDKVVPYLNPSVQGIDKAIRNLRRPETYAKGLAIITAPTTALYMLNQAVDKEAYDQLDNRTKDTNFLIPMGDGQFLKIPKSRESGVIFGSLFERLFRLAEGQQEPFKGFFANDGRPWEGTVGTNFAPANPFENNILAPFTLNMATNRDFAGRSIVPEGMLRDKRASYLQYDEQSSEIAKWLGEQAKNLPGLENGLSPKQIDYLIKSYTGIIGQVLQPATTKGGDPFSNVIKRGFTANAVYNNEVQNNFYKEYDKAMQIKTDKNLIENIPKEYVTPEDKRESVYAKAATEMSQLRKQEKEILGSMKPGKARDERLKIIRQQILDIAQSTPEEAERVYQEYQKTYIPEISSMSEKQQERYRTYGAHLNIDPAMYNKVLVAANKIEGDKNPSGDTIQNSASRKKKQLIDGAFPNATREQLVFLYEAAGVSKTVGRYRPQFE